MLSLSYANFLKKVFQEHFQIVKQFGFRSGNSESKLFAVAISIVTSIPWVCPNIQQGNLGFFNPFKQNRISNPYWMAKFISIEGLLVGTFHFYSYINRKICKPTVKTLIRCLFLWHLEFQVATLYGS